MKRVLALVEGQTEERFVKDVLNPHLWEREVYITPTIATTKRVKSGPDFKGGITSYGKVEYEVNKLLNDTNAVAVTTFVDYYGLPTDFPGMSSRPSGNPIRRASHVEIEWKNQVDNSRFIPYLMIHEFEAILFSKPEVIGVTLNNPSIGDRLLAIRSSFSSPEEINDNPNTAPSKRITNLLSGYQKVVHGPIAARRIGLEVIRNQCAHFDNWLRWLESL